VLLACSRPSRNAPDPSSLPGASEPGACGYVYRSGARRDKIVSLHMIHTLCADRQHVP